VGDEDPGRDSGRPKEESMAELKTKATGKSVEGFLDL
jgi:hypothetical protein